MRIRRAALLICICVVPAALVGASAGAAPPPRGASSTNATNGVSAARTEALALYHQGQREYELGHFDDAIALLGRAYALSNEPVLQYDLARAYEGKGDLDAAVRGYEAYLSGQKDIPDRAAIERRVATVRMQIAERARLQRDAAEARARAAALRPAPPVHPWPWVLMGAGAIGGLVGAGFGVAAEVVHDEASEKTRAQVDTSSENATARRWATAATVSWIAGGALAAGGLVFWLVDRKTSSQKDPSDADPPRTAIVIRPSFAGVDVSF